MECLRSSIGNLPIYITSGYRCHEHNVKVKGAKNSYHLKGKAADIYIKGNMAELGRMANKVFSENGVGIYKNFIHVDTGPKRKWKG